MQLWIQLSSREFETVDQWIDLKNPSLNQSEINSNIYVIKVMMYSVQTL